MRRALASILLLVAFLLSFAGSASAYVDYGAKNRVGSFGDPFAPQVGFADPLALELHQENTIAVYDPVTGVLFYVRQNPWTFFDPLGLQLDGPYKPKKWTGAMLWSSNPIFRRLGGVRSITWTPHRSSMKAHTLSGNKIIGTQKYGFVDIGHVRHNMDRTLSFHIQLSKMIKDSDSGTIPAGVELRSGLNFEPEKVAKPKTGVAASAKNVHEVAAQMALDEAENYEKIDFEASKYSTEDLPSNKLGVEIAKNHLKDKGVDYAATKVNFADEMDKKLEKKMMSFSPLSKNDSRKLLKKEGARVRSETGGVNKTYKPYIFKPNEK